MKKLFVILTAILTLAACEKGNTDEGTDGPNLIINFPQESNMLKTGWEAGDKVFLFFEGVTKAYATTVYDGSAWEVPVAHGVLTLSLEGKRLTAVYLPFGDSLTPTYQTDHWEFDQTQYSYYLSAENVDYSVSIVNDKPSVNATINMVYPEGFVQLFLEDGDAPLICDAVVATGLASIGPDGTVTESVKTGEQTNEMDGYAYKGGKLYSGRLAEEQVTYLEFIEVEHLNYVMAPIGYIYFFICGNKTYFFPSDEAMPGHSAVTLPRLDSGKWFEYGPDKSVTLDDIQWASVNEGATCPWEVGNYHTWANRAEGVAPGWHVPTQTEFETLNNTRFKETIATYYTSVRGVRGTIVVDTDAENSNFIFMPAGGFGENPAPGPDADAVFWTDTQCSGSDIYFYIYIFNYSCFFSIDTEEKLANIRPVKDL